MQMSPLSIESCDQFDTRAHAGGVLRPHAVMTRVSLLLGLCTATVSAGGTPPTVDLFNGHDLQGWQLVSGRAVIESPVLVLHAGARVVYTEFSERGLVLRFKYQRRGTSDATPRIYYHGQYSTSTGRLSGDFIRLRSSTRRRLRRGAPASVWNQLELRMANGRGTIQVNGRCVGTVHCGSAQDGFIGLGVSGSNGANVAFKDVTVTEVDHRSLFNGVDLTGWEGADQPAENCWRVENGLLVCTGQKGPWLRCRHTVGDFDLRLQYKLKPGGNSGVYTRVPANGNHHGAGAGVEVQILDDAAARYRTLKPYQFAGSLYAVVAASPHVGRPAGQWNALEITCRADHYTVRHNGRVVIDVSGSENAELAARRLNGYLGLQNHSETVWFRDLRIQDLR